MTRQSWVHARVAQVFARSSKFSLFDPAKEMVYIEMSKDEKSKGKAAVDLVGSQIGKSGASWLTQARAFPPLICFVFPPFGLHRLLSLVSLSPYGDLRRSAAAIQGVL